jgi:branched-chain amino acid transport system substrate-binding protein
MRQIFAIIMVCGIALPCVSVGQESGAPDSTTGGYANTPEMFRPYSGGVEHAYRQFFNKPLEYPGPGRDKPEPNVDTVRIGVLAPIERSHEDYIGKRILAACSLAVAEANKAGGYYGKPFGLAVRNDTGLWGASANEMVSFSYSDSVWAVIGSVDGANTHIAIRVALKSEMPVINVADTDPTLVETAIPWVFRVIADDRQMSYTIAHHLYHDRGFNRVAIVRANNRYGRFGIGEFRYASIRMRRPAPIEINYDMRWAELDTTFSVQIERLRRINPEAVILWGDARPAAHLVRRIREAGLSVPIYASDRVIQREFVEIAGIAAEGVVAMSPYDPTRDDVVLKSFQARYEQQTGEEPDVYAAHAYDGMSMAIQAIREAGLNRYRIRDALAGMHRYHGVTGEIMFDEVYADRGPVSIATYRDGRWQYGKPVVSRIY